MYWPTPYSTVVRLAPRLSVINHPSCHAGFLHLVPFLQQSHESSIYSIHHSSSLNLQVFVVVTYSFTNCGFPCSSLVNYQQSIMSCGIPASCAMCYLHYHHGSKRYIKHASSSRLPVFDVLTYSLVKL
jgi:hypothetical protein